MEHKTKQDGQENSLPRLSNKEMLVLELLLVNASSDMYGLELVEKSGDRLKRGTIYVTLGRMEEKGYITSRQETEQGSRPGIPRRLYKPTGYGRRVFAAWSQVRNQLSGFPGLIPGCLA